MKHFPAKSPVIEVRKGQAPAPLERAQFSNRFLASFIDPAFRAEDQSIARLEKIAWIAYSEGRKAPFTRKAGPGYVDPDYDIVKDVKFPWPVKEMILQHHERLDGSGYPQGLQGEQIILEARILAVADVIEAMSSHRPYRAGLGLDAALAQIRQEAGTKLDSQVVDACERVFHEEGFAFAKA